MGSPPSFSSWGFGVLLLVLVLLLVVDILLVTENNGGKVPFYTYVGIRSSVERGTYLRRGDPNVAERFPATYVSPGHMGGAVKVELSNKKVAALVEDSIQRHGFNEYAASLIPVRRVLPDLRDPSCVNANSNDALKLVKTAIVIVFYNEPWSVLARTVFSVLDNTPGHLLDEILLVDDCSFLPHLKTHLEEYFRPFTKVRILRAQERLGLIRARMLGAQNTSSALLTFLDAHVECTKGWLEPLLAEVTKNETTIAVPLIDRIDDNDMHLITNVSSGLLGAFQWDLNFGWWHRSTFPGRLQPDQAPARPFETPAMAGGLFTISRAFFAHLGWYDEGFRIYGMENTELSIKAWICGGKILTVPCSHVAHIRKRSHPFLDTTGWLNVTLLNSVRLAEVWMDEFRQIVFDVNGIPGYSEDLFGSVTTRKAVRARAACRPFRYYLQRAYPEMPFPVVTGQFRGEVHNAALGNTSCLTVRPNDLELFMSPCDRNRSETQFWTHNFYQELNSYRRCIDVVSTDHGLKLAIAPCHRMRGSQAWHYDTGTARITNVRHQQCLTVNTTSVVERQTLKLKPCADLSPSQKWHATLVRYDFWKAIQ